MNSAAFADAVREALPEGTVIPNLGGGTSTIVRHNRSHISYRRGASSISVRFADLCAAYSYFRGRRVTSTDLRRYQPFVFDSAARPAGHSCNCTFMFTVLNAIGLCGPIEGSGMRGDPFAVQVFEKETHERASK